MSVPNVQELSQNCSVTLIQHASKASHILVKLFWTCLLSIAVCCTLFQSSLLFLKYKNHDKTTTIVIKHNNTIQFPAITICNLNPYKASSVMNLPEVEAILRISKMFDFLTGNTFVIKLVVFPAFMYSIFKHYLEEYVDFPTKKQALKYAESSNMTTVPFESEQRSLSDFITRYPTKVVKNTMLDNLEVVSTVTTNQPQHTTLKTFPYLNAAPWLNDTLLSAKRRKRQANSSFSTSTATMTTSRYFQVHLPLAVLQLLNECLPFTVLTPTSQLPSKNDPITTKSAVVLSFVKNLIKYLDLQTVKDETAKQAILAEALPFVMSSLSAEEREMLGYTKSDMIVKCWFNSQFCDIEKDFVQTNDLAMGNCFTFNHESLTEKRFANRPGITYGLSILLKLSQHDYMPTSTFAGIKVFIDDREQTIFPDSEGSSISPGFNADFSVDYSELRRLSSPYGNCTNEEDMKKYFFTGHYSFEGCIRTCYQKQVLMRCGCGDPRFSFLKDTKTSFCSIDKIECVKTAVKAFGSMKSMCDCHPSCIQKIYKSIKSISKKTTDHTSSTVNSSNMTINVYFRTFTFFIITEIPAYDIISFFADLGGTVGNNLDASFITLFEFFVSIIILIVKLAVNKNI